MSDAIKRSLERIKLLFPWYRELKKLKEECVSMDKRCAYLLSGIGEKARKLNDADKQIHELAEANRQLINRAKRYREQMREHGIAPRMETTRGTGEPARLGAISPAPLPTGVFIANAKSARINSMKNVAETRERISYVACKDIAEKDWPRLSDS